MAEVILTAEEIIEALKKRVYSLTYQNIQYELTISKLAAQLEEQQQIPCKGGDE